MASSAVRRSSSALHARILQPRDEPPVDGHELPGDVRRAIRGEEGDESTELIRLAVAPRWNGRDVGGSHRLLGRPLAFRSARVELVDAARTDRPASRR